MNKKLPKPAHLRPFRGKYALGMRPAYSFLERNIKRQTINMKTTTILAISAAVACVVSQASATPIYGQIDLFGGGLVLNTASASTATAVNNWGAPQVGYGTSTLAGDTGAATVTTPWTFTSGSIPSFITFDGFTFALTSSAVEGQAGSGFGAFVAVSGTGILSGNGYTPSAFNYSFSSTGAGTSFQATLSAVPDGGTTVALLGGALTVVGLIRRKLVA